VEETCAFLWSENPGLEFSDGYLNECGVAVVSDGCRSREDDYETLVQRGEIRHGGIGYMLRRLVAERANSARHGVSLMGSLLDRYGYADAGRTYVVADPTEAWLVAVVRGRRWVAQRVPDDEAVLLPNVYIIGEVDLRDRENFAGSPDLVEYAVKRGWFDPEGGEPFHFARAYGADRAAGRDPRQHRGQRLLTGKGPEGALPFSVKPAKKLGVRDVLAILRNRTEPAPICNAYVQEGAVFQLRRGMPASVGCVYWRTTGDPSVSPVTPWYPGVLCTPKAYFRACAAMPALTLKHHFQPPQGTFDPDPSLAWWTFKTLQDRVYEDYENRIGPVRSAWKEFEDRVFTAQAAAEAEALEWLPKDRRAAEERLTRLCASHAEEAMKKAGELARRLDED
jgi:dipeptidase